MDENRIIFDREVDFIDDRIFNTMQKVKKVVEEQRLVNKQVIVNAKNINELEKQVEKVIDEVAKEL